MFDACRLWIHKPNIGLPKDFLFMLGPKIKKLCSEAARARDMVEVVDQDDLQLMDESTKDWVHAWYKEVKKKHK